jgi:hypothetical protein
MLLRYKMKFQTFEQEGIFIVPHLLCHRAVSSEAPRRTSGV